MPDLIGHPERGSLLKIGESSYENGVKVADMEFKPGVDPDYYDLFCTIENKTTRKYCKPSDKSILFAVTPSAGATGGEVRVTDMFGNIYKQTINF